MATLLAASCVLFSAPIAAAAPSCAPGDRPCGRAAFSAGTTDFDRGEYASALEYFRAAAAAEPHPVISFNIALSYARLGKPTAAEAELSRLLADANLDASLRVRAEAARSEALRQIAYVGVDAPASGTYSVTIDGERADLDSGERAIDPGPHHILIASGDTPVFEQDVTLQPGERLRLRVTSSARAIDVVVVPQAAAPSPPSRPAPEPGAAAQKPLSPVVFYATAGVTVLLGAATIWSGLDVRSAYDDYKADLPRLSQEQANARVEDGHDRELRTNVLLAATAVGAATSTLMGLLWVDFKPKARQSVSGFVTPFGAQLSARF